MTDVNQQEPTDDDVDLSQQVFSVYCDQVLRDAVEKNEKLQAQNAAMEAARDLLIHMKLYKGLDDEIVEINLQKPAVDVHQQNDTEWLIYEIHDSAVAFPYAEITALYARVSNVRPPGGESGFHARFSGSVPVLIVRNDETVQLHVSACSDVNIIAEVTNFAGTLEQVREMISSNRFMMQFSMMETPFAQQSVDNSLDGAVVTLKKVVIAKKELIHPVVFMTEDQVVDGMPLNVEDDELETLAQSNPNNTALVEAANDRKAWRARNFLLKESREAFQTITGRTLDNTVQFELPLDQGSLGKTVLDQEPAWIIVPSGSIREGLVTLQFSAIAELQLELANIPLSSKLGPAYVEEPQFTENACMILKYSPHIEAVFYLGTGLTEEIINSLPTSVFQHIYIAIARPEPYQGPDFTVRLLALHIRLSAIQSHLDALGIDTNSSHDESLRSLDRAMEIGDRTWFGL